VTVHTAVSVLKAHFFFCGGSINAEKLSESHVYGRSLLSILGVAHERPAKATKKKTKPEMAELFAEKPGERVQSYKHIYDVTSPGRRNSEANSALPSGGRAASRLLNIKCSDHIIMLLRVFTLKNSALRIASV